MSISLINNFVHFLRSEHYSEFTIKVKHSRLCKFADWCRENSIRLENPTTDELEKFLSYLYKQKIRGRSPGVDYKQRHVLLLKEFYGFLHKEGRLLVNPATALAMPKTRSRLPGAVLNYSELEKIFSFPDVNTVLGLRDRTILELLYATAIRKGEFFRLDVADINFTERLLFIEQSKGNKDRYVPFSPRVADWLDRYLTSSRPRLVARPDAAAVFLTWRGNRYTAAAEAGLFDRLKTLGIDKKLSCHTFRRTAATHMLENGMDIRYLQELLGHESLESTQLYTRVSVAKLKEVHEKTHPAKLPRIVEEMNL